MCSHTGLLTVCFACLFLSAPSTGSEDNHLDAKSICDVNKLFNQYSTNGSLSFQGLNKLLKTYQTFCSLHWNESEKSGSLELTDSELDETLTNQQPKESANHKGKFHVK